MSAADSSSYKYLEDELYRAVVEALNVVRRRWYVIVVCAGLGFAAALAYMNVTPGVYTATAAIVPNPLLAEFRGGGPGPTIVSLGHKDNTLSTFDYLLSSPRLGTALLDSPETIRLFYPGEYDVKTRQWIPPRGAIPAVKRALRRVAGLEPWVPPDAVAVADKLGGGLHIVPDAGSEIITLSTTALSPGDAERKLHWLLATADGLSKQDERRRIDDDIAFLTDQLTSVRLQEHRDQLTARLSVAVRKQMMLATSSPYNFLTITPVQAGNLPSAPRLGKVLEAGIGIGILVGLLTIAFWRPRRP